MGTQPFIRNIIVAGIFFLFIISTVVPNLNVAGIISEDNLAPMTTKVCSLTTGTTHMIQLSKQQAQDVQLIFDNLQNRLSSAESAEETQRIFNDTIIELDRHNLLPDGMNIEQAQLVVNHAYTHQQTITILQKLFYKFQTQTATGSIQNSFCSIAGNISNTHFAKLAKRTALRLYYIIDFNTGNAPLNKMATALFVVFNEVAKINQKILRQNGSHLGVCIYFGNYHYAPYPDWLSPAQGWISTNGVYGKQNITGSFWGQTMTGGWQPQVDWYMNYTWRGCLGFTGLIYYTGADNAYFLGSALSVNVGPNRP